MATYAYYRYVTDSGKNAAVRLSQRVAIEGGFELLGSTAPNGAIKKEHCRHIGLRENASPFRHWQRPCAGPTAGGYEKVGTAKTCTVSGVAVACTIVGSTGEKTRLGDLT